ncbi:MULTISPECIES: uracil-DNA glycosylase [Allobacillus]|uniref:Uracil-DNA glycosylase n=1 Tax=Allobacillus salarius TaxID=1955272 RepID=A0A556PT11_9BACI|nr:uracil-DNA glycosylase [Allobacillus salarius]TSJ67514.1 uracil-DNA glycosylase [Allobacillus salarius]
MHITTDWNEQLANEFNQTYFQQLIQEVQHAYEKESVFPAKEDLFRAFNETSFDQTKVVIIGQDPYHGVNQANGLSFSVAKGQPIPPSLRNIFKELSDDMQIAEPTHGDLTSWANQGVLLLNSVLTVRNGEAFSHRHLGWEQFTDQVIEKISKDKENVVFILWGKHALKKGQTINPFKHLVIHSAHPSPLSAYRGFFGSKPFSKANQYLVEKNKNPIDWRLS